MVVLNGLVSRPARFSCAYNAGRGSLIKILPPLFAHDPGRLARFEHEARMLAALNHPHIAAIYGLENVNGSPALVLELVEGETLPIDWRAGQVAQLRGPVEWMR